ncbi:MAG: SPOR domain-containing protein [Gallionella sp.]|nr:SPOR domain-containing protein [Gallionella sp.]
MAKQLTDDELNLRRKARRRLIGAVALTLAVVVILPMVLDSEPKPTGQDIELRIPAPDKVGEFIPGVAVSEAAAASPFAASAVEAAPVPAAASAVAPVKPAAASNPHTEVQGKIHADKQPEAKAVESKSPESKNMDKPAGGESFVAQVGAYTNPETAKQEANRLKKLGFKAYTEKAGDKVRVRVGPYAEREKAEKVRQLLGKHGLHPTVMSVR